MGGWPRFVPIYGSPTSIELSKFNFDHFHGGWPWIIFEWYAVFLWKIVFFQFCLSQNGSERAHWNLSSIHRHNNGNGLTVKLTEFCVTSLLRYKNKALRLKDLYNAARWMQFRHTPTNATLSAAFQLLWRGAFLYPQNIIPAPHLNWPALLFWFCQN